MFILIILIGVIMNMLNQVTSFASVAVPSFENTPKFSKGSALGLLACGVAACSYVMHLCGTSHSTHAVEDFSLSTFYCERAHKFGLSVLGPVVLLPVGVYLHELGHALAMRLLYSNSQPKIVLNTFGLTGGYCSPGFSENPHLSKLGLFVGGENISNAIIFGAGPLVSTVKLLALSCLKGPPSIQLLLSSTCFIGSACNMMYALEDCFGDTPESGDYKLLEECVGRRVAAAFACTVAACSAWSAWSGLSGLISGIKPIYE